MSVALVEPIPVVRNGADAPPITSVLVYAKDPISRAGVASQLDGCPRIAVLDPSDASRAQIAIVVADVVDEEVVRVVRTIRRASASARVVLVASDADTAALLAAAEAGASGMLKRSAATAERLVALVERAQRGEPFLPPRLEERHMARDDRLEHPGAPSQPPAHRLSARDLEVLRLLAEGCDTAEIAHQLAYSEPTIKNVIQRLFECLKARNRPHAVAVALRSGII